MKGSTQARRQVMMTTIRDKINDLGLHINARRYNFRDEQAMENENKLKKLMMARRGDDLDDHLSP
jgi:hypothetical protein